MKKATVLDCMAEIEKAAQTAAPEVRVVRHFSIGKHMRQGDVYLHRLPDEAKYGKQRGSRQVAVGTTVGSRHIAEGALTVHESNGFEAFPAFAVGPVVVASEEWTLTHPEHAHCRIPGGVYQVIYQREGQARVQD